MTAKQDAPRLSDLLPWSVPPLRLGRSWVMAPDRAVLRRRWNALVSAADPAERERLFHPTRARTLHSAVGQLPGQATATGRLLRAEGPCPDPVRVLHGAFDQQWLLPDHRLIDAARPELWRVADAHQLYAVALPPSPQAPGPAVVCSAILPDGRSPAGRPGRIHPLHRRPGGREPNLAPGLSALLAARLDRRADAADLLAWIAVSATHSPEGCVVPLTADPDVWDTGVALGERLLWLQTRGAHSRGGPAGERPRMPGGRRPYVRAALPAHGQPAALAYDADEEALLLGTGRIAPVPAGAWDTHAGGVRVLESWFTARTTPEAAAGPGATSGPGAAADAGPLSALRPAGWQQEWTSELLELITVLALLAELRPRVAELRRRTAAAPRIDAAALRAAGVLPPPPAIRRPASVLDHQEEGPEGQFALL